MVAIEVITVCRCEDLLVVRLIGRVDHVLRVVYVLIQYLLIQVIAFRRCHIIDEGLAHDKLRAPQTLISAKPFDFIEICRGCLLEKLNS